MRSWQDQCALEERDADELRAQRIARLEAQASRIIRFAAEHARLDFVEAALDQLDREVGA